MNTTDGKTDRAIHSTGFAIFGSDKPGSAWWVWTGNAEPEAWATSARPFWTRALAAIGRQISPNAELKITREDLRALARAVSSRGSLRFDPEATLTPETLRAFAWLAFHNKGTLDDVAFPRANGVETAIPPGLDIAIADTAMEAPRTWQLGMQGQDALIRKSVGLPQLDSSLQYRPSQNKPSSVLPLVLGLGAAAALVYYMTKKSQQKPKPKELADGSK